MISVIIPTYNRAGVLKRAVESVYTQTFTDIEIIIVDDGSSDSTPELIGSLDLAPRFIRIPHSGVSRARNVGIDASRGEWIAFLDSDDYWLPGKLRKQMDYLRSAVPPDGTESYLVCHTNEVWIRNGKRINQGKRHAKKEGWFFLPSLNLCLISPSSVLIHRSVLRATGYFDEGFRFVEDYDLWLRITARYPVGYVDEKLVVKTGGHEDQLSRQINGIEGHRLRALRKLILSGGLEDDFLEEAIRAYTRKADIYIRGCRKRNRADEVRAVSRDLQKIIRSCTK